MGKKKNSKPGLVLIHHPDGGFIDKTGERYTSAEGAALILHKQARVGEWHGGKKKGKISFEGVQYTGGRKKGKKNLVKTDQGTLLNQHNVEFTKEEKRALERAVNASNYKRKKMLKEEGELPRLTGGKPTGEKVAQLQLMGKESDFILSRQSKSLNQFKSKQEFYDYLDKQARIRSGEYLSDRVKFYKRNHIKALENVFGDDAKDVMMKIQMMKQKDYMELIQKDEDLEINYIYDPSERAAKLNRIRAALGMKLKEGEIKKE